MFNICLRNVLLGLGDFFIDVPVEGLRVYYCGLTPIDSGRSHVGSAGPTAMAGRERGRARVREPPRGGLPPLVLLSSRNKSG